MHVDDIERSLEVEMDRIVARHRAKKRAHTDDESRKSGSATDGGWPDPEPFSGGLPGVPAMPTALIPADLRPLITDIAERMQCPLEYPAAAVMTILGALIGRRCAIRPKRFDDWAVVPNLWGAIVGPPGFKKTPAMKAPLAPLRKLEDAAREAHAAEMATYRARKLAHEAEIAAVKQNLTRDAKKGIKCGDATLPDAPEKPAELRYTTSDATIEKLGELLADNPAGIMVIRDELTGFLRALDKPGRESDRAFFLESWDGDGSFTFDRIGRGTIHIPAACVSVFGGIQPGPLGSYLRDAMASGAGADGLMQRFQVAVYPDPPTTWRNVDRKPDDDAARKAAELFGRLGKMEVGSGPLRYLRFATEAQKLADEYRAQLEARIRAGGEQPAMVSHIAKYRSLMPAMALICHLAGDVAADEIGVGVGATKRALAWIEFLEAHARRIYASAQTEAEAAPRSLAKKIEAGEITDRFRARDVYRHHWAGLADSSAVKQALECLAAMGWVRRADSTAPGRPRGEWDLHPQYRRAR